MPELAVNGLKSCTSGQHIPAPAYPDQWCQFITTEFIKFFYIRIGKM
jgi:hypothetical protein